MITGFLNVFSLSIFQIAQRLREFWIFLTGTREWNNYHQFWKGKKNELKKQKKKKKKKKRKKKKHVYFFKKICFVISSYFFLLLLLFLSSIGDHLYLLSKKENFPLLEHFDMSGASALVLREKRITDELLETCVKICLLYTEYHPNGNKSSHLT